jgi:hypothetical protein
LLASPSLSFVHLPVFASFDTQNTQTQPTVRARKPLHETINLASVGAPSVREDHLDMPIRWTIDNGRKFKRGFADSALSFHFTLTESTAAAFKGVS